MNLKLLEACTMTIEKHMPAMAMWFEVSWERYFPGGRRATIKTKFAAVSLDGAHDRLRVACKDCKGDINSLWIKYPDGTEREFYPFK